MDGHAQIPVGVRRGERRGRVRSLLWKMRPLARLVNPVVLRLPVLRLLPLYGVVEHRGRRSGRTYRTPVWTRRVRDGFIVPLILGEGADWYRNVLAAGGATLVRGGRRYAVAGPAVVPMADAHEAFAAPVRWFLSLLDIDTCVRVRIVTGS